MDARYSTTADILPRFVNVQISVKTLIVTGQPGREIAQFVQLGHFESMTLFEKVILCKAIQVQRAFVCAWAEFPEPVLSQFVKTDFLRESHATEMHKLLNFNNLAPWLTRFVEKNFLRESHAKE